MRRLRQHLPKHSHHGNKVWKSSALLVDYLKEFPLAQGAKVLEVGAGWGLGSLYCAKYFHADVTALDIDPSVFPVLQLQAEHNGVSITPWLQDFGQLCAQHLKPFNAIIASDICFWDESTALVLTLIQQAVELGVPVIIADPGRPPFIDVLNQLPKNLPYALENWSVPHPYNYSGLVLAVPGPSQ